MLVMSNGRVRRTEKEWREIIERFERSGLSRRGFCGKEKLNKNSFESWRKRLASSEQSEFVDVTPIRKSSSTWAVEVELGNGTIVRIGS